MMWENTDGGNRSPLGKVASCATVNNGVVYLVVYVEVSRMG